MAAMSLINEDLSFVTFLCSQISEGDRDMGLADCDEATTYYSISEFNSCSLSGASAVWQEAAGAAYSAPRYQATSWSCSAKLIRAAIAEGLVRPFGVIPFDPLSNGRTGFSETSQIVLRNALFLEAAEEALDEAVLLGRNYNQERPHQALRNLPSAVYRERLLAELNSTSQLST
jgi:hypothetical protein